MKVQVFDSSYFHGKSNFEDDDTQYYLVFQPVYKYFKKSANIATLCQRSNLNDCLMKVLNLLLHLINSVNGNIEESEEMEKKCLTLFPADENKDTLKKYEKLWNKIRDLIRSTSNNLDHYQKNI